MRLTYLLCLPLLAVGCGDAASDQEGDSFQDDDIPMGGCNTSGTGCPETSGSDGGAALGDPCDGTSQCATGVCAAPFGDGEAGELVCQTACVDYSDEARWCSDAAACCDPNATCSRGYCLMAAGVDESGAASSDDAAGSDGSTGDPTGGATGEASTSSGDSTGSTGDPTGTTGA